MITFLQPWLWLGGLLVTAPLWLHLLRRLPTGAVRFSALKFLDDEPRPKRRGLRFRDALLLSARLLALLLVVAAFSRPQRPAALEGVSTSRVHILDNTLSLQAVVPGDGAETGFEQARRTVLEALSGAPANTQDAVVVLGARPEVLAGFGDARETAIARLEALRPSHQRGSYLEALRLAQTLLDGGLGEGRRILFHGDGQSNQWQEDANSPPFLRDVELELVSPTTVDQGAPNVGVASPRARLYFVGDETWIDLAVEVHHRGAASAEFRIDAGGLEVAAETLDLASMPAQRTLRARWPIDPEQWVEGVVEVTAVGDVLAADDRAYFTVPPVREGRVALLARSPYLRLALAPEVMRGRWRSELVGGELSSSDGGLTTGVDTSQLADVLVLEASLAQGQGARELLRRHLEAGRGVVLLLDRVTPLVRSFLDELGLTVAGSGGEEPTQAFRYFAVHHPIFRPFAEGELGNLDTVRVHRAQPLVAGVARPLIYGEAGSALLVEGLKSKGRLLVFTFGFGPEGTDWALQPTFIPFLDLTLQYARAGTEIEVDRQPGERLALPLEAGTSAHAARWARRLDPRTGSRAESSAAQPSQATPPTEADDEGAEERAPLRVEDGFVRGRTPDRPGLYALHLDGAEEPWTLVAVNPSPLEGELEFDPEPAVLETWRLPDTPDTPETAAPAVSRRTRDDTVSRVLLWLAALALVVETWMLWRGRRPATAAGGNR